MNGCDVMNSPKVSIIIPIFNPGKYFIKCLDSVVNQTLTDIEIICIDDGSTDDSMDILGKYSNNDSRFKIFHQENFGAGPARNKGIDDATGEYIIFLDSDDWIEKDMCEKLYYHAKNLDVDLVLFDVIWYLKDNKKELYQYFNNNEFNQDYTSFVFDRKFIYDKIVDASLGVIWSKFYKTSFLKNNNIKFSTYKIYNDVVFHFKTILVANKIAYYPHVFYHYIKVGQPSLQTSYRWGKYESIWFNVMMEIREFLVEHNLMNEFKMTFISYSFTSFERKLRGTEKKYKEEFFAKIKYFYESFDLNIHEFHSLIFWHQVFFIHIVCSENYEDFNKMNEIFDGKNIDFMMNDYLVDIYEK